MPHEIRYDGIGARFTCEQPALRMSVFLSPDQPTVWAVWEYSEPREAEPERKELVRAEGAFRVWRVARWASATRFEVAHTCVAESVLVSSVTDYTTRSDLVHAWTSAVEFSCPDLTVTAAVYFAKIRTCEAVFDARVLGRVHSPGGGMFYAGVWCNDQAEYACPALVMLGGRGSREREAALNSLRVLARYFDRKRGALPYSVEIDGGYVGQLDRGDAGMFAWGAAKVVLTIAEREVTEEVFPWVMFACDVLLGKMAGSPQGVVRSESDELEGRFPTGDANFSVNCIAILALETASEAALTADDASLSAQYADAASSLRASVERHFHVADSREYAYYSGCPDARGWVCLGALARLSRGEAALGHALCELWRDDGVLTSEKAAVVWDRCTLYAIRAAFEAGLVEEGGKRLKEFARRRVCEGAAAPYAVENNESLAQLAAESALLVRVVTESLLGMSVRSGRVVKMVPRCPGEWGRYSVRQVFFADACLDFRVERTPGGLLIEVTVGRWVGCEEFKDGTELSLSVPEPPAIPVLEVNMSR